MGILLGGLSDCEEFVGIPHRKGWGYSLYVTSVRVNEELSHVLQVVEVEVQVVPFEEVSTVPVVGLPLSPRITPVQGELKVKNLLFP